MLQKAANAVLASSRLAAKSAPIHRKATVGIPLKFALFDEL
jgi:hypothetical protein